MLWDIIICTNICLISQSDRLYEMINFSYHFIFVTLLYFYFKLLTLGNNFTRIILCPYRNYYHRHYYRNTYYKNDISNFFLIMSLCRYTCKYHTSFSHCGEHVENVEIHVSSSDIQRRYVQQRVAIFFRKQRRGVNDVSNVTDIDDRLTRIPTVRKGDK